jgi:putative membrane protein
MVARSFLVDGLHSDVAQEHAPILDAPKGGEFVMALRARKLSVAMALLLAGTVWSQVPNGTPTPQNQPGMPQSSVGRVPDSTVPGIATPGTFPDQQLPYDPRTRDQKFVRDAAEGSMTEVELGKMAQQKASSDAVREFGKRMVEDHSKACDELKQAAAKVNIQVPTEPPKKARKMGEKLSKFSGMDFDRAYAKLMLKDHKKDVNDFNGEARNGNIPEVKQFAAQTLPKLQEHVKLAEQLDGSMRPEVIGSNDKDKRQ